MCIRDRYYGTFPAWVTTYNDREGLDFRIGNMSWEPYLPVTVYKLSLIHIFINLIFCHLLVGFKSITGNDFVFLFNADKFVRIDPFLFF